MAYRPHPDAKNEITKYYEGLEQLGALQAVVRPSPDGLADVERQIEEAEAKLLKLTQELEAAKAAALETATDLDTVWPASPAS